MMRSPSRTSIKDVHVFALNPLLQIDDHWLRSRLDRARRYLELRRETHGDASSQRSVEDRNVTPKPSQAKPGRNDGDKLAQRQFFMDILNVSATKRDAKQYLARFKTPAEAKTRKSAAVPKDQQRSIGEGQEQWRLKRTGVNLGNLYVPGKAIAESPTFQQQSLVEQTLVQRDDQIIHVALVGIRAPQLMDDRSLDGLALTMAQLVRLDMQIVVTIDCADESSSEVSPLERREMYRDQADRIMHALEKHNNAGARYVDAALGVAHRSEEPQTIDDSSSNVEVVMPELIVEPLTRTSITLVPALAYSKSLRVSPISMGDSLRALSRMLSGMELPTTELDPNANDTALQSSNTSLDRIILVDPLGGLPSHQREDGSHVFVNLEQEYDHIAAEYKADNLQSKHAAEQHLRNMSALRDSLKLLPPTSSALIISPEEAASSSLAPQSTDQPGGISTRRQKNPLIHNLLTNKPVFSSSLPEARLTSHAVVTSGHQSTTPSRSTLLKRGMPLIMIPDPRKEPWLPPANGESSISLENHPDIHFPRLLGLIEDSFRRKLDVQHYLRRIQNRIAGIIIAGEYEGGAILTWEAPPASSSTGSEDVARLVPYLDKFAVLQRSQGNAGVADIVFQAMVRSCFPQGVCWRSRKDNPVNKWYFERSRGTWQIPDSNWTMFWTTEGVERDRQTWEDYAGVCRSVEPSWADANKPD